MKLLYLILSELVGLRHQVILDAVKRIICGLHHFTATETSLSSSVNDGSVSWSSTLKYLTNYLMHCHEYMNTFGTC